MIIFRRILLTVLIIAVIALILRTLHIPGGAALFVLSVSLLFILFYVNILMIAIRLHNDKSSDNTSLLEIPEVPGEKKNYFLLVIAVICNVGMSVAALGSLYRYMFWPGSKVLISISLPFIISGSILLIIAFYIKHEWKQDHKRYLVQNITFAWIFIAGLTLAAYFLPNSTFYYTFHSKAAIQSYEEFKLESERIYGK